MATNSPATERAVSIVIPTFRRPAILAETLRSVLRQDYPPDRYEVIVVDDGSGDATAAEVASLQAEYANLRFEGQPNQGVAAARNRGARVARGEVLIFLDDDMLVPPTLIRQHLAVLEEFGSCLVNGHWEFAPRLAEVLKQTPFGRFRMGVELWVKQGLPKRPLRGSCVEPEAVTACNLGVRREDFWQIGGFDEQFPFAGCEDVEFSLRASESGYRFVYNYDLRFWHNDHVLTLEQFCERQRRGAVTAVLLSLKHPEKYAGRAMLVENGGVRPQDPAALKVKKWLKALMANGARVRLLHRLIRFVERVWPRSPLLPRLYWGMCGLFIFRGVREGLDRYGLAPTGPNPLPGNA
jgi:GT2 family glycosyltransferase